MIMDERNEFADNVAVNAAAGTALIGDVIDLGSVTSDIGNGETLFLMIKTGATAVITGGAAGTVRFQLVSDAQAALATDGSATVHFDTGAIATGATAAGVLRAGQTIAMIALPLGTYERFLGVLCITATTTTTAGTIDAFLTKDPSKWIAMPDAPGTFI
jgi:hypothetical protein